MNDPGVEQFRRQIPDAWDERVTEDRARCEDMVGEAPRVGVLLADAPARLVHQETAEDVGCGTDSRPAQSGQLKLGQGAEGAVEQAIHLKAI